MPYIDKQGRPELIGHPSIKTGYASPRIETNNQKDDAPPPKDATDPAPGAVHGTPSAASRTKGGYS